MPVVPWRLPALLLVAGLATLAGCAPHPTAGNPPAAVVVPAGPGPARTPVRFDYRRSGQTEPGTRHLQPWGVITDRGRWYLVGHDRDRNATRASRQDESACGHDGKTPACTAQCGDHFRGAA